MSTPYSHIRAADAPSLIRFAAPLLGVREQPGPADNPTILAWANEVTAALKLKQLGYKADSIPWCGLFVALVAHRASWTDQIPPIPLRAKSWLTFGEAADSPMLGDILVFGRDGGGHVGLYVGEDPLAYHVLGGNQSDAVTITRLSKSRLLGARRPKWRVAQPSSVRIVLMGATGLLSENEA